MAVNLSPVGGAAAQFFDNSGNVLTGGKLYTYLAGTTTPAVTYTTNAGITAHANPIVLNAAGRVPDSGEIWLADSLLYKFVLKDANDVQIATWDNIVGINSNFVNYTGEEETQTATQGQTVFTLTTIQYQPATNNLLVFVNGSKQVLGDNFTETSATVVTFVDGLNVGDVVDFCTATPINTTVTTAGSVSFTGFKGQVGSVQDLAGDDGADWIGFIADDVAAVARSAQDKMQDIVSVKDFGATGDGVTDDYAAIQAALDAATDVGGVGGKGWQIDFPAGTYLISQTLEVPNSTVINGAGRQQTIIRPYNNTFAGVMMTDKGNAGKIFLQNFRIEALNYSGVTGLIRMGYGVQPLGQAVWSNLFFSGGLPGVSALATCTGIDTVTNVFDFIEIEGGYCGTDFNQGANSVVTTYDKCYSINAVNYAFKLNGSANIINCEIEAPEATCLPVYCSRETNVENMTFSQAASTVNPYVFEIDAGGNLTLTGFVHYKPVSSSITNLIKDNRLGYPTYWGPTGNYKNVSFIGDELFVGTNQYLQNLQRQSFQFELFNDGGTIKHRIGAEYDGAATSAYAQKISGASATLTATPTGTDATTAFVTGVKISSTYTNCILLNTPNSQNTLRLQAIPTILQNSSGTALTVYPQPVSVDVNGTTNYWLGLFFYNAATGAAYNLTTLPSSKVLVCNFDGYLA